MRALARAAHALNQSKRLWIQQLSCLYAAQNNTIDKDVRFLFSCSCSSLRPHPSLAPPQISLSLQSTITSGSIRMHESAHSGTAFHLKVSTLLHLALSLTHGPPIKLPTTHTDLFVSLAARSADRVELIAEIDCLRGSCNYCTNFRRSKHACSCLLGRA